MQTKAETKADTPEYDSARIDAICVPLDTVTVTLRPTPAGILHVSCVCCVDMTRLVHTFGPVHTHTHERQNAARNTATTKANNNNKAYRR